MVTRDEMRLEVIGLRVRRDDGGGVLAEVSCPKCNLVSDSHLDASAAAREDVVRIVAGDVGREFAQRGCPHVGAVLNASPDLLVREQASPYFTIPVPDTTWSSRGREESDVHR